MAEKSDEIRQQIEHTREEMGETVDALAYKADVPSRTKGWLGDKKEAVTSKLGGATSRAGDALPDASSVKQSPGRLKSAVERNPLGLAIGGAAVGILAGLLAPSTRAEDKRIGQLADDVKSTAAEAGREAIERGKHVAQEAGQTAIETAKERGQQESEELTASLEGKARELSSSSQSSGEASSSTTQRKS